MTLAKRVVLFLHLHVSEPRPEEGQSFGLVGNSVGIEQVRAQISQVADWPVPVLIRGETGTGKELVARALHERSSRRHEPFISVNLGALAPSLAPAELFGSRKGAYTGSVRDQPGFFALADRGTLFLDEIGEAPTEVQAMLLRVLETGEVLAVGSRKPRSVDVRVVSATDAELDQLSEDGSFRSPLLHRLDGYRIQLPPLRQRRDDIGRLLIHFLAREISKTDLSWPPKGADERHPWLPAQLMTELALAPWPGNVRQLQNVARRMVIDSQGHPTLRCSTPLGEALGSQEISSPIEESPPLPPSPARWRKPSEVSEEELISALREHGWNRKATAKALGISRTSLYALLDRSPQVRSVTDVSPKEIREAWQRHEGDLERMVEKLEISSRALRQRLKDLGLPVSRP